MRSYRVATNLLIKKGKGSPYSITEHRVPELIPVLWSHNEETRELPGERDNARNNAR